jgi:hypothetical protein
MMISSGIVIMSYFVCLGHKFEENWIIQGKCMKCRTFYFASHEVL